MLMDEPFGAVDPIVRDRLQNEFLRLQETIAKTILFVTHDIDEAIKMGDLVAVFQTGGILAQFGPPLEILAAPASEFVARFVGQDRGLKRLSLLRVADVPLQPAITARPGDDAADARRRAPRRSARATCCSSTTRNRPIGWVAHDDIPAERRARPRRWPTRSRRPLNKRTTLKDALSMMLDADVQTGIVVDRTGAVQGLLTVDAIAEKMREGEHAAGLRPGAAAATRRSATPTPMLEDATPTRRRGLTMPPGTQGLRLRLGPRRTSTQIGDRLVQHLQLTVLIPLVLGHRDLAGPRDLGRPPAARLRPDHRDHRPAVHDPEPRGVRPPAADLRPVAASPRSSR